MDLLNIEKKINKILVDKNYQIFILLLFCITIFFLNLNRWDLWNPDEPRYAQVAREMIQRGDWILMHFNGKPYSDKPPLFFWLIGLSSYLWGGFTSISVRFFSAFFGTLTVLITFFIGRNLYSHQAGFLAGFILATSIEFAHISTRANIDATLTFFITLALFFFIKWFKSYKDNKNSNIIYGFYVGIALATLTKGPVGFILPLLVSLIYISIQRDWKLIKKMKLTEGLILFMLIVLSWYVPALVKGGKQYFNETIMLHTIDRFAKGSSHIRPFYYYLYNFPIDFLPWIFFLPSALFFGYSKDRTRKRDEFLFLFIWFITIFLFFSISKGKRGLYLLPLFPAVSLMVGRLWEEYISNREKDSFNHLMKIPIYIFITVSLSGGLVSIFVVLKKFPFYLNQSILMALILFFGGTGLFIFYRLKYRILTFYTIVGMIALGLFYTQRFIFPLINPYKSARFISQEIKSRIKPDEKLIAYGDFVIAPYIYYTEIIPIIEIDRKEDLLNFLKSGNSVYCLLKYRDFKEIDKLDIKKNIKLIIRRNVGGDDMVLILNN